MAVTGGPSAAFRAEINVSEFLGTLKKLESDKVTERKVAQTDLKRILDRDEWLDFIDECSHVANPKGKGRTQLASVTWERLVSAASGVALRDYEALKRNAKREYPGVLFKVVIRAGNRRAPQIALKSIVDPIVQVLNGSSPEMRQCFAVEYSNILLKDVLVYREYRNAMACGSMYKELILLYCEMYSSPVCQVDRSLLTAVLEKLVLHGALRTNLPLDGLFRFLKSSLANVLHERNTKSIEGLLALANTFFTVSGANTRRRVCALGEPLLNGLTGMWSRCQPAVRRELLVFLQLQLVVHFPCGRMAGSGAWAVDWEVMKKGMMRLHQTLLEELDSMAFKLRWSSKGEALFDRDLIELAADTFRVVNCMLSSDRESPCPPVGKRPRQVSLLGWDMFHEQLQRNQGNPSIVVWLQILSRVLEVWAGDFPLDDFTVVLEDLNRMLAEVKRPEVVSWTVKCLRSAAVCQGFNVKELKWKSHQVMTLADTWDLVWSTTVRILNVHSCEQEGFQLLTAMLKVGIAPNMDHEMWKLFVSGFSPCSSWHAAFLAEYLRSSTLPEDCGPAIPSSSQQPTRFVLRNQLIKFLLPVEDFDEVAGRGAKNGFHLHVRSCPMELASVLVALTQRSCSIVGVVTCGGHCQGEEDRTGPFVAQGGSGYSQIESLYLSSSFDDKSPRMTTIEPVSKPSSVHMEKPIAALSSSLLAQLSAVATELLKPAECEGLSPSGGMLALAEQLQLQAYHCSLIVSCVYLLLLSNHEEGSSLTDHPAVQKVSHLLDSIVRGLNKKEWNEVESKNRHQLVAAILNNLMPMFSTVLCSDVPMETATKAATVSGLLAARVPKGLVDVVGQIAKGKWFPPSKDSQQCDVGGCSDSTHASTSSTSSRNNDGFDLMEVEPRATATSVGRSAGDTTNTVKGMVEMHAPTSLDVYDKSSVCGVRLLVVWLRGALPSGGRGLQGAAVTAARNVLLSMLSAESLNLSDPRCVHVVLCVAKLLECERLKKTDLEALLDGIRNLLAVHSRDPSVSTSCLTALQSSAHHLAALGDPSSEYSTELCQKFLSAFWMLNRDGQLSPKLRLKLVECLHAYLMVDPGSEWMVISEKRRRKEREALPPGEATLAVTLKEAFLSFLKDNDHQVRMKVAHLIPVLFEPVRTGCTTTQFQPLPRSAQEALFAGMKQAFSTPPDVLLTEMESCSEEDETLNNMSSRLATFQSVMCVSSVCECPVLLMVLAALGRHLVELTAVDKMLCQVAACLGYTTKEQFLEDHLVSMVTQWLTDGFRIEAFPCKLFGFDEVKDFLLKHSDVVVPVLVWRNDKEALRKLEDICVCSSQDLLRGCLPRCMLVVLTTYASQKEGLPVDAAKKDQASACHDLLSSEYFGEEELSSLLRESMDEFLVEVLTCLYEDCNSSSSSSKYLKYFLPSDPELNPPHFSSLQVSATLQYVAQCYGLHHSSLVATLSKTKDSLQSILLSLSLKLCRSHRSHTRRRLLVSYLLFVELIASDLQTGLGGSKLYLVHTIIHFVLNFITSEREGMKSHGSHMTIVETTETGNHSLMLCFDILKVIFDAAVIATPQELGRHLPLVVSSVLSATRDNLLALVSPLLDSLASSCSVPPLSSCLGRADPIPAEGGLRDLAAVQVTAKQLELGRSLQDDMVQVVSIDHKNTAVSPVDSLKQLRERMREEREETMKLIHANVMSEEHTTVVHLLQYLLQKGKEEASTEEDDRKNSVESCAVVAECARCLGELGSVDLKQVALPDVNKIDDCASSLASLGLPPNEVHTARVLKYLCDLLVNKDVEVVKASCDSLKAILATFQGSNVLSQLEKMSHDPHLHWCQYLEPFTGRKKGKATTTTHKWHDVTGEGNVAIGGSSLWNPWGGPERKEYGSWLTQLVLFLLRDSSCVADPVLLQLTPIASIKVEVCELVFPFIVYDALFNGGEDCRKALSDSFRVFFTTACCAPLEDSRPVLLMVSTIMYLRTVPRSDNNNKKSRSLPTAWDNNFWLDVDYLMISKATQHCSLHLTSLLCLEIAVGEMEERGPTVAMGDEEPEGVASGCLAGANPVISSGPHANDIHSLLVDIYSNIGEPDGLYGVYSIFGSATSNRANKLKMFEHEGQWLRALGGYALEMNAPAVGSGAREGLVKALHSLGWHSLSEAHTSGGGRSSRTDELKNIKEYQFESAWRSTLWEEKEGDRPLPSGQALSAPSFAQCIFFGVEAVRHKSLFQLEDSVMKGRTSVFASWLQAGESTSLLYPVMSKLQSLLEVEETAQVLAGQRELQQLLLPWKQRLLMMDADYSHVEPVLSLRCVLLQILLRHSTENVAGNGSGGAFRGGAVEELYSTIGATLLWQAELARKAGQYQLAESAIFSMSKLAPPPGVGEAAVQEVQWGQQLEESQLHWALGETSLALQTLRDTTQRLEKVYRKNKVAMQLYPRALCLYGSWLAETRTENPNVILAKYLQPAVTMIDTLSPPSSPPNCVLPPETAYITLARYADRQYQGTVHHMQSSTFEAKKELLRKSKKEAAELSRTAGDRSEASRHLRQLNRHSEEDQAELQALVEDRTRFLHIAVKNYILCLKAGDSNNLCVFRLCSLWFDNCSDKLVNEFLKESVAIVESRKFLPLLYQLAARVSKTALESDLFQQVLQEIILYTAKDHPHHSLYIVLAMGNAPKDDEYPLRGYVCGSRKSKSRRTSTVGGGGGSHSVDEDKVQAARALVAKLRSVHGPLVRSTERLCEAYIELAYHDSSVDRPKGTQGLPLPINCALSKLGKLDGVAIPTLDVPVDPTCCYDNVIQIEGFDSSYMLAGGMNVPKVLSCIGSDGIRRRQLLKGRDDLRQDAVMQQVFRLVNQLLVRDSSAARRKLHIRTYNVVPLSQRSGIVEWCEGTVPLGEYLVHPRTGAHLKYHPHDWPSKLCRQKMESSKTGGRGDKLKVFKDVMSHFKPVFRHFFFEKFPSPSQWFERRLAYTRSVATSSIVGYIVGLGDRHVQNILVDTNSAEVIHIDLGVAFEQGRTLPTPEKVPFRLTRDIIDGMGVCGIEGVFRRCCEEILNTMKASREEVKTIVEVLLHDPLYMWTITPNKSLLVQPTEKDVDLLTALAQAGNTAGTGGGTLSELDSIAITQKGTTSASKMAERALFRLQEKLDGYEDGIPLSTSGQVNFLLQSATDIVNLSSLFPGWQAWV